MKNQKSTIEVFEDFQKAKQELKIEILKAIYIDKFLDFIINNITGKIIFGIMIVVSFIYVIASCVMTIIHK